MHLSVNRLYAIPNGTSYPTRTDVPVTYTMSAPATSVHSSNMQEIQETTEEGGGAKTRSSKVDAGPRK
jgi:hypothetical protein